MVVVGEGETETEVVLTVEVSVEEAAGELIGEEDWARARAGRARRRREKLNCILFCF